MNKQHLSHMSTELCECPVCLEEIGDNNRITTECGHTFHASCIIQNLHTSPLCPMCRTDLDDAPTAQRHLEDLDDETMDTLVDSILDGTHSNHRVTNNIMIFVDNYLNGSIPNNRDALRTSISEAICDYANEFAFDYTHMLRDWASNPILFYGILPPRLPAIDSNVDEHEDGDGEYPLSDWDILENAYANACSAAALGDQDAIAFRENFIIIRQGINDGNIQLHQVSFLGDREPIYETPHWREVYARSNAEFRNILHPHRDHNDNDNDNDLSDPHGLNPVNTPSLNALVNALDNDAEHAERQNDHIINNNLDNHIYNRIQIISNTIPINSPGLTLQEVENLLMD